MSCTEMHKTKKGIKPSSRRSRPPSTPPLRGCYVTRHSSRMSLRHSNGQTRPGLWVKYGPCLQIHDLSTAAAGRVFVGKLGPDTLNSFPLFGRGVLSALQNSWEATSLEMCSGSQRRAPVLCNTFSCPCKRRSCTVKYHNYSCFSMSIWC